jgi:glycosyltransferase involved in cell wall biosynthesis
MVEGLRAQCVSSAVDVDFTGEIPHESVLEKVAACDLFVFPSHTEGFPNAVAEAMAMGKCVIASDVGAIGAMLDNGCGVTVQPRDVEGLAAALRVLTADHERRTAFGDAARQRARRDYALAKIFDDYSRLWRAAAGQG